MAHRVLVYQHMNSTITALESALVAMRAVIDTGALKRPPAHLKQEDVDRMRADLHTAIELANAAHKAADLNAPPKEFEPSELEKIADVVSKFRVGTLLSEIDTEGADVNAEQFYLLALSSLEQAERYFKLASYAQARALAGPRRIF